MTTTTISEEQHRHATEWVARLGGDASGRISVLLTDYRQLEGQFDKIVSFMAGRTPGECDELTKQQPGTEKSIALIYEGPGAVGKIRDVLGPTDPSKAPPGSIRREFGQNIMVNAAHASDSEESARREFGIVNVGENTLRQVVDEFYGQQ